MKRKIISEEPENPVLIYGHSMGGCISALFLEKFPDSAVSAVLLVHGLSEFAERYIEHIYYFYNEGYSVFAPDLRGHGRSGRKIPEANRIFIRNFDEYLMDLQCVMEQLLKVNCPENPVLIYGHSMGGCISAFQQSFRKRCPHACSSIQIIVLEQQAAGQRSL